ncbi:MAG TPA: hypothetical protein EYH39_00420 [Desulfurobacteriaceae bacterium]|nr:hypothetical protein [Desulfurobacteriaceae bacterium]
MKKIEISNTKLPLYINFFLFLLLGMSFGAFASILPPADRLLFSFFAIAFIIILYVFIYTKSLKNIINYFKIEFYLDKIIVKDFFGRKKLEIPINQVEIILIAYKKSFKIYNVVVYIKTKKQEYHIPIITLKPILPEIKVFYKQARKNVKVEVLDTNLIKKISGEQK